MFSRESAAHLRLAGLNRISLAMVGIRCTCRRMRGAGDCVLRAADI